MSEDKRDDLVTVLARFVHGIRLLALQPPEAILMGKLEDGARLLHELAQRNSITVCHEHLKQFTDGDGIGWMQIEVHGLKIRWPTPK